MPTNAEVLNTIVEGSNSRPGLQLTVFPGRYGGGAIAFLCANEDQAEAIVYHYTAGDSFYEKILTYHNNAKWFPVLQGHNAVHAIELLLEFLENTEIQTDLHNWVKAVERACSEFTHMDPVPPLPPSYKTYMKDW